MGEEYSVRFEVTFMPARECARCDQLTTQGIGGTEPEYYDFVVLPLCPVHGYVAPHIGGLQGEQSSIGRFVCWIHGQRGSAQVTGPVEVEAIDEWRREHPQTSVKIEVQQLKAWAAHHTYKGKTSYCFVVWNEKTHSLEYYNPNKPREEGHQPMDANAKQKMSIFNQYRQVYGDLAQEGAYMVGQRVYFDGGAIGEVLWKYQAANGLTYVLDDNTGFPVEAQAGSIEGRVL